MEHLGAIVFGKTSTEGGREWIDNGFQSLSAKATAAYETIRKQTDIEARDAYTILDTLRKCKELEDDPETAEKDKVSKAQVQLRTLRDADFDMDGKAAIYYCVYANDKEKTMMEELEKCGADMGKAAQAILEIKTTKDNQEKWEACIAFSGDAASQMKVLETYMPEGQYKKVDLAYRFDVDPDVYVEFLRVRQSFDEDGNGSYTNLETKDAIDSMDSLSRDMKAALWQIATSSKKGESNPYNKAVGQSVLNVKAIMEEDEE